MLNGVDGVLRVYTWSIPFSGGLGLGGLQSAMGPLALTATLSLLSFMSTLFPNKLFAGFLHRPLLRVLLFLFIFGTFFIVFFPPTDVRFMNVPHSPGDYRPLLFDPPQPGSNSHRIKVQRPITMSDAHRNKDVWARRADAVRDAFSQAYNSYVTYASPYDELLPLSKAPMDTCVFFIYRVRAQLT